MNLKVKIDRKCFPKFLLCKCGKLDLVDVRKNNHDHDNEQ